MSGQRRTHRRALVASVPAILLLTPAAFGGLDLVVLDVIKVEQDKSEYRAELLGELVKLPLDPTLQDPAVGITTNVWCKFPDPATLEALCSPQFNNAFLSAPPAFTDPPNATDPDRWLFAVGVEIVDFIVGSGTTYTGIDNMKVFIAGKHVLVPHPPDRPNFDLPTKTQKNGKRRSKGKKVDFRVGGNEVHPPDFGLPNPRRAHYDRYYVECEFNVGAGDISSVLEVPTPGEPNVIITAEHNISGKKKVGRTTGAEDSFYFIDYNPQTEVATMFASGNINNIALNTVPTNGPSGAQPEAALSAAGGLIDPEYANDPVLTGFIEVTPVVYEGFDEDLQVHRFSGGTLEIFGDPLSSNYTFDATFDEMFYDPETEEVSALLTEVGLSDFPDEDPSPFLAQFMREHAGGEGGPGRVGIQFTFKAPALDVMSNNFTMQYFPDTGTTFLLTGAQGEAVTAEAPAASRRGLTFLAVSLLLAATTVLLGKRRAALTRRR